MTHVQEFLAYIQFERRYSPKTVQAYQNDLEQFFLYTKSSFDIEESTQIKHIHVRSWLAQLCENEYEARSLNRKISTLKSYYKFLMKMGHLTESPMIKVVSPKIKKRLPSFVNQPNIDLLLNEIEFPADYHGKMDRLILEILYATGMRRSELLGLKELDIDVSLQQVKVLGKGNKERIIPLQKPLLNLIQDFISEKKSLGLDHTYLLVMPNGKRVYDKYVYNVTKKYLSLVTTIQKRSPHVLRHTFATHLLNEGADLNAVKELLGHANLTATQLYTHNTIDKLKDIHKKAHPRS